jgi:hypothetical protein
MGMRFSKFHSISHITNDIRNMGVCSGLDTGSNESGHKPTKQQQCWLKKRRNLWPANTNTFDGNPPTIAGNCRNRRTTIMALSAGLWQQAWGTPKMWGIPGQGPNSSASFMRTPRIIASKVCQNNIRQWPVYWDSIRRLCGRPARFVIGLCRKAYHTVRARA